MHASFIYELIKFTGAEYDMERVAHGDTLGFDGAPLVNPLSGLRHLFPDLAQDPDSLLPESSETSDNLARLGDSMRDRASVGTNNSCIHSGYTYLGQFIDHDIVFTHITRQARDLTDSCMLGDSQLRPFDPLYIYREVTNQRTAILELETIYGGSEPAPRDLTDERLMALGRVVKHDGANPNIDDSQDLPLFEEATRAGKRVPRIGDPRNDQTVILSQLHVAFLRAHNAIVRKLQCSFDEAQLLLRQHYLWMIVHDFLMKRVAQKSVVERVLNSAKPRYSPQPGHFFLPLEFTSAAFRFGHSMIRSSYYLNDDLPGAELRDIFILKAVKNPAGGSFISLPLRKVVSWKEFLPEGENVARLLDTQMVEPLLAVLDAKEEIVPCEARLAVQDLKRGYMMRLPTGQAIASKCYIPVLTENQILNACANVQQREILLHSPLLQRTPLWFYLLAEATAQEGGDRLGELGSYLVSEVLISLVRRLPYSFINLPQWSPTLGLTPGEFGLKDLFLLAGVLSPSGLRDK
jgi:hypothetical protein